MAVAGHDESLFLAGKRPTPADRLDGASLTARVEIFLQQRVGSNPLGDDAQFVAQMAAVGLHRMAERRLATPNGHSRRPGRIPEFL